MSNDLPVPPELQHLIEKRERDQRRKAERRSGRQRREIDLGPVGSVESAEGLDELALEERRSAAPRRRKRRRKKSRRKTDADP